MPVLGPFRSAEWFHNVGVASFCEVPFPFLLTWSDLYKNSTKASEQLALRPDITNISRMVKK